MNIKQNATLDPYKQEIKDLAKLNRTSNEITEYLNDKYKLNLNSRQVANYLSQNEIMFKTKRPLAQKDQLSAETEQEIKRIAKRLIKFNNTFAALKKDEKWVDNNLEAITNEVKKELKMKNIRIIKSVYNEDIILTVVTS